MNREPWPEPHFPSRGLFPWEPSFSVRAVRGWGRQVEIPPLYSVELVWLFSQAGTFDFIYLFLFFLFFPKIERFSS